MDSATDRIRPIIFVPLLVFPGGLFCGQTVWDIDEIYNGFMSEMDDSMEKTPQSAGQVPSKTFQLREVVEMGEYDPEYLGTFAEWHTLSKPVQWSLIKKALDIRERQLVQQWAEINNILDFRLKPELKIALKNIEKQRHQVMKDRETLLMEYFG